MNYKGVIAAEAESLVTVEFMEDFLVKNRELNGHNKNTEFICDDVLGLDLDPSQFDIVFSCWLKMYLADDEVGGDVPLRRLVLHCCCHYYCYSFFFLFSSCCSHHHHSYYNDLLLAASP